MTLVAWVVLGTPDASAQVTAIHSATAADFHGLVDFTDLGNEGTSVASGTSVSLPIYPV